MPFDNLINLHFTAAEISAITTALNTIQTTLLAKSRNLSPAERQQYGSISEQNKLLVQKVRDYRTNQPTMSTPDVDWTEFEADYQDRNFLEVVLTRLDALQEMASDTKILHDYDVYQAALLDYDFTKYKMGASAPGFDTKYQDIKQFFPNPTGNNSNPNNTQ